MRRVIVESPYKADTEAESARYERYLSACLRDCLINHGEAPFASHRMYAQDGVLRDSVPAERDLGIEAGLAWGAKAHATIVYNDLGVSEGMTEGITAARKLGRAVEYRQLGPEWEKGA